MIELAWAAGFFDGEGHIRVWGKYTKIDISQVDRRVLDRFRDAVGLGKVFGPYGPYQGGGHSPHYRYIVVSEDAETVAAKLLPFLSPVKALQVVGVIGARAAA